jgi:hypothetical protein
MIGRRCPTCRDAAVGSNPTYPACSPLRRASSAPSVASWSIPRQRNSSKRCRCVMDRLSVEGRSPWDGEFSGAGGGSCLRSAPARRNPTYERTSSGEVPHTRETPTGAGSHTPRVCRDLVHDPRDASRDSTRRWDPFGRSGGAHRTRGSNGRSGDARRARGSNLERPSGFDLPRTGDALPRKSVNSPVPSWPCDPLAPAPHPAGPPDRCILPGPR